MIRRILLASMLLTLASAAMAQDRVVPNPVRRVQEYVPVDATTGLPITQATGGGTVNGATSNGSDGQTTTATNVPSASYNFLFNGATWDRWRGSIAQGALVYTTTALPAGANAIGSITNVGFNALGTAGTALQQGAGATTTSTVRTTPATDSTQAVTNAGTFTVQNNAATPAGTNNIGSVTGSSGTDMTTTPLAANAGYGGTARTAPAWASYYRCRATVSGANANGSINIFKTTGGTTYTLVNSTAGAVAANSSVQISIPLVGGASVYQCNYNNNATTAQTTFLLEDGFTAN